MTAPAVIPGVVDGTVTASTEPDGTVSLRITIGPHTDDCDYIELIITADHATRIATTLLHTAATSTPPLSPANPATPPLSPADPPATTTAPCSVGVRLTTGAAGTTGTLRR
ncbi:hypothetical protein ACGH2B_16545 [Streptomyces sp. BBFR2]|uniref:hypothetical protein n=1 Tax=Streptomyces sp. BBFR2 TaxID=3372854 RepID=UPI0037D9ACF1